MEKTLVLALLLTLTLSYPQKREESVEHLVERGTEDTDPSEEPDDEPATCSADRCVQDGGRAMFLKIGQEIQSSKIRVAMQTDGNLVVYCKHPCPCRRRAVWSSGTNKKKIDTGLKIEKDGNLALYDTSGKKWWESNTHNPAGKHHLVAQEDSNLVLYLEKGGKKTAVWSTKTSGKC